MTAFINETNPINYSRPDEGAKLLWQTQVGKANPWDHRSGHQPEEDEAPKGRSSRPETGPLVPPPPVPDELILQHPEQDAPNPFEVLLRHRT